LSSASSLPDNEKSDPWSLADLLKSITGSQHSHHPPLDPALIVEAKIPDGFIFPQGLDRLKGAFARFLKTSLETRSSQGQSSQPTSHEPHGHNKPGRKTRRGKRKRNHRENLNKSHLDLTEQKKRSLIRASKRREARESTLPRTRHPSLDKHLANTAVVGGGILATELPHSQPSWLGLKGDKPFLLPRHPPEQPSTPPRVESDWDAMVKERVQSGWTYVKNDIE
jgi:hypothetical protein